MHATQLNTVDQELPLPCNITYWTAILLIIMNAVLVLCWLHQSKIKTNITYSESLIPSLCQPSRPQTVLIKSKQQL